MLIEITAGKLEAFVAPFDVYVGHTPAFEVILIAGKRPFHEFHTHSGVDIPAYHVEVGVGVEEYLVVVAAGLYGVVFFRK